MEKKNITLGGGCFWCTEAIFRDTKGVLEVKSGFSGGFIKNPAYREVRTGRTGHAEVIQVSYDPEKISLHELLTQITQLKFFEISLWGNPKFRRTIFCVFW